MKPKSLSEILTELHCGAENVRVEPNCPRCKKAREAILELFKSWLPEPRRNKTGVWCIGGEIWKEDKFDSGWNDCIDQLNKNMSESLGQKTQEDGQA